MRYVYVGNMGGFWRLTMKEWRALCEAALEPDWPGYDLEDYRALRSKPSWARKSDTQAGYWVLSNDVHYVEPIDWSPEEFADELQRLDEL
jgi:hypothetical protein